MGTSMTTPIQQHRTFNKTATYKRTGSFSKNDPRYAETKPNKIKALSLNKFQANTAPKGNFIRNESTEKDKYLIGKSQLKLSQVEQFQKKTHKNETNKEEYNIKQSYLERQKVGMKNSKNQHQIQSFVQANNYHLTQSNELLLNSKIKEKKIQLQKNYQSVVYKRQSIISLINPDQIKVQFFSNRKIIKSKLDRFQKRKQTTKILSKYLPKLKQKQQKTKFSDQFVNNNPNAYEQITFSSKLHPPQTKDTKQIKTKQLYQKLKARSKFRKNINAQHLQEVKSLASIRQQLNSGIRSVESKFELLNGEDDDFDNQQFTKQIQKSDSNSINQNNFTLSSISSHRHKFSVDTGHFKKQSYIKILNF